MPSQGDNKLAQIKRMRKLAIAIVVLIFTILIVLTIMTYTAPKEPDRFTPGDYSPGYIEDTEEILNEDQISAEQNNAIANLLEKLPHQGRYFSMRFNNDTVKYEVVISQRNKTEGDAEFDEFLKANGILGRDRFINLNVQYK